MEAILTITYKCKNLRVKIYINREKRNPIYSISSVLDSGIFVD